MQTLVSPLIRSTGRAVAATTCALTLALAGAVGASGSPPGHAPTPAAASPYCGIAWGSLDKVHLAPFGPGTSTGTPAVTGVRVGRHACFDRVVVDVRGHAPGYAVRYVDVVRRDGSGAPVSLSGGARLALVVHAPSSDTSTGASTFEPTDPSHLGATAGFTTLRQVAGAGSFEGLTTLGIGVRARLPFRVFTLTGPGDGSRVVVDIAHHW